jgi:predicted nucleic acid-binding protein
VSIYVVDTNLYIDATHLTSAAAGLQAFYERFLPSVHLHSVVAHEILLGVFNRKQQRAIHASLFVPFEKVSRIITPTHATWRRASEIVLELVGKKKIQREAVARSFYADCLIAASAREHGFILVTGNAQDFRLIRQVETFTFVEPWPTRR